MAGSRNAREAVTGNRTAVEDDTTKAVAIPTPDFSATALKNLTSWEDLGELFDSAGVELQFADQVLGDGFSVLSTDDKGQLIGVPLALLEWRFNDGQQGRFVSIRAVAKTGINDTDVRKVIINDGSTGIMRQLDEFTQATGKSAGLLVRRGFRVSEYMYEDEKGVQRPAKTYYLDTSAE